MIKIQKYLWPLLLIYVAAGWVYPIIGSVALLCMLAPVALAIRKGRYWCGNLCPRGSFFDHVIARIAPRRKVPRFLRSDWFRVVFFMLIMALFGYQLLYQVHSALDLGKVFLRMIVVTTALGLVLAMLFQPRAWCAFCPMGSMARWISRLRRIHPRRVSEKCVNCKLCARPCPMNMQPHTDHAEGDCISCGKCRNICPKKAIEL